MAKEDTVVATMEDGPELATVEGARRGGGTAAWRILAVHIPWTCSCNAIRPVVLFKKAVVGCAWLCKSGGGEHQLRERAHTTVLDPEPLLLEPHLLLQEHST